MKTQHFPIFLLSLTAAVAPFTFAQEGPNRDRSETVARPRSKDGGTTPPAETQQPKLPSAYSKKETDLPQGPTFRSDVTAVTVDASVHDKNGRFIPKIGKQYFRILEDGVPQAITRFEEGSEAPMTVALVVEWSNLYQQYWTQQWYETLQAVYGFVETLRPEDFVAVVAYDMKPEILSDFSTNRQETMAALQRLRIAAFSETNLYDALADTVQRMSEIEGRKAVVVIASGRDTFSKLTFDQTRKVVQQSNVPVYALGLFQALRIRNENYMGPLARMDYLQADVQMKTFAKESGGQSYFPRFEGEFPDIFRSIAGALRSQYTITYTPANTARDGKFRKIKVELVEPGTDQPLKITDEKKKPMKYTILATSGYTAPRAVE